MRKKPLVAEKPEGCGDGPAPGQNGHGDDQGSRHGPIFRDSVTDPDDLGNLVPNGLLPEDGYCFDIERPDKALEDYVLARVLEAFEVARRKEG